ncbi:MAG: DNA-binding transcriptional LysR family regulator [Paracoccaceae bacterium]|jgi:DNA-binding transcriptional LysR family regulator
MSFEHWDEVRTAYQVARMGTVSGAAEVLGVHHATVIRHIDALEGRLGAKLFQRHARGYTPTEAGQDLLVVAASTDDQFTQLAGRIKGRGNEVTGDLVVTSLGSISPLFVPAMAAFQKEHPDLTIRLLTDERLFRLEYGEAHVAIRAGKADDNPDNIVQPFFTQNMRLVAHADYVAEYGLPDETNLDHHRFIGSAQDRSRAPFFRWMAEMVPESSIVYRTSDLRGMKDAVLAGIGIGFVASWDRFGTEDLVEMLPPLEEWASPLWLVTHMDLHRTAKVQTFLQFLKEQVKTWDLG